jgi:hypothetical protein
MAGLSKTMRQIGASWTFGAIALIATLVLGRILNNNADCHGISVANLPLQKAWTVENASAIVRGWHGCEAAAVNQVLLDYLFIVAYVALLVFFGLRSRRAAQRRGLSGLACAARLSTWAGFFAGVLDCCENIGLLLIIGWAEPPPIVPFLTSLCSFLKYLLIAINVIVALITFVTVVMYWLLLRPARPRSRNGIGAPG